MLLFAVALLAGAFALYLLVPDLLLYAEHPWVVYVMLLASVGAAFASRRRGKLRWATVAVTSLFTVLFLAYSLFLSRLPHPSLAVGPGDRFPDFTVLTSERVSFSPEQLRGQAAALYIFYRGDW